MLNTIKNDSGFIWNYYDKRIALIDDNEFLSTPNEDLREFLKFSYLQALNQLTKNAKEQGKTTKQLKYEAVKLRRTIARLVKEGVLTGNFNISYSERDILNEFPIFDKENFDIIPTDKTINKLRVLVIKRNVEIYNNFAKENGKKEITDLRGLRNFLLNGLKLGQHNATVLTKIYDSFETTATAWNVK